MRTVSESKNKDSILSAPSVPGPAQLPLSVQGTSDSSTGPGEFSGLRPFPSNPYQETELPPPPSPIAELVAGALFGAVAGLMWGLAGNVGGIVGAPLVGSLLGILDGYWVGRIFGRAGFLSAWTVMANFVRIPLMTMASFVFPYLAIRRLRQRDVYDR
jgi:hypothetical protein